MKRYKIKLTDNEDFTSRNLSFDTLFELVKKIDPFDYVSKTMDCPTLEILLDKGVQFQFEESGFETIQDFYNHTMIDDFVKLVKAGDVMALDGQYVDTWTDICIVDRLE